MCSFPLKHKFSPTELVRRLLGKNKSYFVEKEKEVEKKVKYFLNFLKKKRITALYIFIFKSPQSPLCNQQGHSIWETLSVLYSSKLKY